MALNRYRLRHLANKGVRSAALVRRLLEKPDRLLGLILLGNNFVNILAASIASVIAIRLYGEGAILFASLALTVVVLIFAEVAPKTVASQRPERVAYPASYVLAGLLRLLLPLVWLLNWVSNGFLRVFGVKAETLNDHLTTEELRTLVNEAGSRIPDAHQSMLLNLLDLEEALVDDIMVPRAEVVGIDLDESWESVIKQITRSSYTRLPVYRENIENVIGLLHIRAVLPKMRNADFDESHLIAALRKPYFIPEGTGLTAQLLEFQRRERRLGLVVDEYGDIQGMVTMDDILEGIVGEITTTEPLGQPKTVAKSRDGNIVIRGFANLRRLNRRFNWDLPTDGPRTLNGLLLEQLEDIPQAGVKVRIDDLYMQILSVKGNRIQAVKVTPIVQKMKTASQN